MLATFTLALLLAATAYPLGNPVAVFGLALLALVAERGRVKLGNAAHTSISIFPTVFAAAVFGPLAAMLVAAASLLGDFPLWYRRKSRAEAFARGAPYLRWGIYTCIRAIYGAVAGFAVIVVASMVVAVRPDSSLRRS